MNGSLTGWHNQFGSTSKCDFVVVVIHTGTNPVTKTHSSYTAVCFQSVSSTFLFYK